MKLLFSKNASGDISAKMQKGTIMEEFDYVCLINQLVENAQIEIEYEGMEEQERIKMADLFEKIKHAIEVGKTDNIEV